MKYRLADKEIYYDGKVVDSFPSKGDAMATFNHIQAAYSDGRQTEQEKNSRLRRQVEEARWKTNFRNLLHVIFWPSLLLMMLPLMTLSVGWLIFALIVLTVFGLTVYGLGRLERVTFE